MKSWHESLLKLSNINLAINNIVQYMDHNVIYDPT